MTAPTTPPTETPTTATTTTSPGAGGMFYTQHATWDTLIPTCT